MGTQSLVGEAQREIDQLQRRIDSERNRPSGPRVDVGQYQSRISDLRNQITTGQISDVSILQKAEQRGQDRTPGGGRPPVGSLSAADARGGVRASSLPGSVSSAPVVFQRPMSAGDQQTAREAEVLRQRALFEQARGQAGTARQFLSQAEQREAILSRPTAVGQGGVVRDIAFQTKQGRTQSILKNEDLQPIISASSDFAGKAATVPGVDVRPLSNPALRFEGDKLRPGTPVTSLQYQKDYKPQTPTIQENGNIRPLLQTSEPNQNNNLFDSLNVPFSRTGLRSNESREIGRILSISTSTDLVGKGNNQTQQLVLQKIRNLISPRKSTPVFDTSKSAPLEIILSPLNKLTASLEKFSQKQSEKKEVFASVLSAGGTLFAEATKLPQKGFQFVTKFANVKSQLEASKQPQLQAANREALKSSVKLFFTGAGLATGYAVGEQIKTNPEKLVGEIAASAALGFGASKVLQAATGVRQSSRVASVAVSDVRGAVRSTPLPSGVSKIKVQQASKVTAQVVTEEANLLGTVVRRDVKALTVKEVGKGISGPQKALIKTETFVGRGVPDYSDLRFNPRKQTSFPVIKEPASLRKVGEKAIKVETKPSGTFVSTVEKTRVRSPQLKETTQKSLGQIKRINQDVSVTTRGITSEGEKFVKPKTPFFKGKGLFDQSLKPLTGFTDSTTKTVAEITRPVKTIVTPSRSRTVGGTETLTVGKDLGFSANKLSSEVNIEVKKYISAASESSTSPKTNVQKVLGDTKNLLGAKPKPNLLGKTKPVSPQTSNGQILAAQQSSTKQIRNADIASATQISKNRASQISKALYERTSIRPGLKTSLPTKLGALLGFKSIPREKSNVVSKQQTQKQPQKSAELKTVQQPTSEVFNTKQIREKVFAPASSTSFVSTQRTSSIPSTDVFTTPLPPPNIPVTPSVPKTPITEVPPFVLFPKSRSPQQKRQQFSSRSGFRGERTYDVKTPAEFLNALAGVKNKSLSQKTGRTKLFYRTVGKGKIAVTEGEGRIIDFGKKNKLSFNNSFVNKRFKL